MACCRIGSSSGRTVDFHVGTPGTNVVTIDIGQIWLKNVWAYAAADLMYHVGLRAEIGRLIVGRRRNLPLHLHGVSLERRVIAPDIRAEEREVGGVHRLCRIGQGSVQRQAQLIAGGPVVPVEIVLARLAEAVARRGQRRRVGLLEVVLPGQRIVEVRLPRRKLSPVTMTGSFEDEVRIVDALADAIVKVLPDLALERRKQAPQGGTDIRILRGEIERTGYDRQVRALAFSSNGSSTSQRGGG